MFTVCLKYSIYEVRIFTADSLLHILVAAEHDNPHTKIKQWNSPDSSPNEPRTSTEKILSDAEFVLDISNIL